MADEEGNNCISSHNKFTIRPKSLFLLKAYQIALDKMRVGARWVERIIVTLSRGYEYDIDMIKYYS